MTKNVFLRNDAAQSTTLTHTHTENQHVFWLQFYKII